MIFQKIFSICGSLGSCYAHFFEEIQKCKDFEIAILENVFSWVFPLILRSYCSSLLSAGSLSLDLQADMRLCDMMADIGYICCVRCVYPTLFQS